MVACLRGGRGAIKILTAKQSSQLALGALVYYLCARFGMLLFSLQPSNITLLWLASGIGLVLVLRVGALALPVIFLASLLANFPGMRHEGALGQSWHVLIAAAADTLSAFLAARFDGRERYVARLEKVAEMERGMLNA